MTPDQYRKQREKLGLTQAGLAALLELTRETINKRESGLQVIDREAELALRALTPRRQKRAPGPQNTKVTNSGDQES